MGIDVETEITIARPRAEVATYASEPDIATDWYANTSGFSHAVAPLMAPAVRRTNRKDLEQLKRILESR